MLRQNLAWVFFNLAESHGFKAARALKAEGETTDAAEQVQEAQLVHLSDALAASAISSLAIQSLKSQNRGFRDVPLMRE